CVGFECVVNDPVETLTTMVFKPFAIGVDANWVYVIREVSAVNELSKIPKAGGAPVKVVDGLGFAFALDAQNDFAYYGDYSGVLGSYSTDGASSDFFTDFFVEKRRQVEAAGAYVYFSEGETPYRVTQTRLDFSEMQIVANTNVAGPIYPTNNWLYFSDYDDTVGGIAGSISRANANLTTQVSYVRQDLDEVGHLASDDDQVFSVTFDDPNYTITGH